MNKFALRYELIASSILSLILGCSGQPSTSACATNSAAGQPGSGPCAGGGAGGTSSTVDAGVDSGSEVNPDADVGIDGGTTVNLEPYLTFLRNNRSTATDMPYSFHVPPDVATAVYATMGGNTNGDIFWRTSVAYGVDIYDDACRTKALLTTGLQGDIDLASVSSGNYWSGKLGELSTIRAGYDGTQAQPFVYDPIHPDSVPAEIGKSDLRGYVFRLLDADGIYAPLTDPSGYTTYPQGVDGTTAIHWIDWKPVTGENAWIQMAALALYKAKYYVAATNSYTNTDAPELRLAKELARAALLLQADNGGVRMAPIGTYHPEGSSWWYNQISTENNISQRAALQMLNQVTGNSLYQSSLDKQWTYFDAVWDPADKIFYQGMTYNTSSGTWQQNPDFAVDCQTWPIIVLTPEVIDTGRGKPTTSRYPNGYGEGAAYQMWKATKAKAGYYVNGVLQGIGYTTENNQISPEWTRGAILACKALKAYYASTHSDWAAEAADDISAMRDGLNDPTLTHPALGGMADSYSLMSEWLPFGWYTLDPRVDSTTSTAWRIFDYTDTNPFQLSIARRRSHGLSLAAYCALLFAMAARRRLARERKSSRACARSDAPARRLR